MPWYKSAWNWVKRNAKFVALVFLFILFFVLLFVWRKKSALIQSLQNKLYETQAKLKLEHLAAQYDVALENLGALKEQEVKVREELELI